MSWLAWILLSACAVGLSVWHYRRRETPGRGRMLLAALRAATLTLILLVLFDPELPAARGGGAVRGAQVLLDASLSMAAGAWDEAVTAAGDVDADRPVLLFGDRVRPLASDSLASIEPRDSRSRLLPALQAAAEAGVRDVLVITDGRIEDADAVARWAPRLGIEIETRVVGDDVANTSLAEIDAPAWAASDSAIALRFGVARAAGAGDSVSVVARVDGRVVGRATVAAPASGRLATGELEVRVDAPDGGGWVPIEVAIEADDAIPDDNARTVLVHVSEEPAGIALVSFRPDWEPRFLAPVLERALGLPLRAYLRSATGRYVRLASGLDAGGAADDAEIRRALAQADLVVLHGLGAGAPGWAYEAAAQARRLLVFPDDGAVLELPVEVGALTAGDFFVAPDVPPSPVAPLLTGIELGAVAPLAGLRSATAPTDAWAPLLVTRGRGGAPQPVALGGATAGRRWVVALGSGYWQWSFRGGTEAELYARLWSALAGWLAGERGGVARAAVRPADATVPRGAHVAWVAPGIAADSIAVRLTAGDSVIADTTVAPTSADTAWTAAPPTGRYSYVARAFVGDSVTTAEGPLVVERYSPEFARPRVDIAALSDVAATVRAGDARGRGTPLHSTAYPYILIVLLLAAEWILRRRWGLR